MLQYLLTFIVGGGLLTFVAFIAQKGNATLTVLVANIPVMFLINILTMYRVGGTVGSLTFAKGALMYIPFYVIFVVITMLLIPRVGLPGALLPGTPVFMLPSLIKRLKARINMQARFEQTAAQIAEKACVVENPGNQGNAPA